MSPILFAPYTHSVKSKITKRSLNIGKVRGKFLVNKNVEDCPLEENIAVNSECQACKLCE